MAKANTGKGCRKAGRSKKKLAARGNVLSLYVRNLISAEEYFKKTNQTRK